MQWRFYSAVEFRDQVIVTAIKFMIKRTLLKKYGNRAYPENTNYTFGYFNTTKKC